MAIKIGPAGLGSVKEAEERLEEYHRLGFKACEIAFTYSVYIKNKEDAVRIGKKAKELGISLSIHAPYFVNLNSQEKEKREASKTRILACCEVASWLKASGVVFHPGYYGKNKEGAYDMIKSGIQDIMSVIKKNGWKVELYPETMGKVNVFGSIEEISNLCKDAGCSACIDFAHILARDKKVDYDKIGRLFPGKKWHCHFSGIIYGEKGEKKHRKTGRKEWKELFKNLPEKDVVLINESPDMIDDCIEGLELLE
ncbi:endonuclease IV [Candidatus Pacearchaeota archaeon CG10_big_fil_rev_8_21_14_0_10_35_219]|nr:TIM barrel protein [Candidatus Pacearchaeota archaeon]OIO43314.1 MAG: hypothetical protein AUJ63_00265 [Candidatus Pacearchaeota archaeon CG1_02_35_32]PIO07756.1 MAG: endonuclease IV [Candidatus Pacearchaeota archaeon CG10_big_fil_rev_8_21_14_0_10_35_219]PIY81462.1 MAG: endonuclease IV [Candidatus Pacearchaeota archaeon CG_4_10_14_0_8_um_filter_35_169]PIZ80452.1 MAG: endonuclease IV [Candidatus Pacearchaeota archaeon CG_4_10_14_0_2_um_filter_35_33]PJA69637.1 MAG: endonuclease IV [Candidatus